MHISTENSKSFIFNKILTDFHNLTHSFHVYELEELKKKIFESFRIGVGDGAI